MRHKIILVIGLIVAILFMLFTSSIKANLALQVTITPSAFSYLPLIINQPTPTPTSSPTPTPSPTPTISPTIFRTRSDACYSPSGCVPQGSCRIYSPDGELYVVELTGTNSMFGVFNAHNNEQLNTFSGDVNNCLKGMAFSPNSRQVALMYHYGTMQNRVRLVWGLPFMPTYTCLPIGYTYYHYMVYWTDTYLAFSYSGSNVDAVLSTLPSTSDCRVWMNEGKGESQER